MARETGSVKWFSNEKGYGFIERQNGEDVFVHHSDILGEGFKTLRQGETVEFEVLSADKGPKALKVVRAEEETSGADAVRTGGSTGIASDSGDGGERGSVGGERSTGGGGPSPETGAEQVEDGASLASQIREKLGRRFFGGG